MATKIEWVKNQDGTQGKTWNPITGCSKISLGCNNCYAERMAKRLRGRCGYPSDEPFRVTWRLERLAEPLRWQKPKRVFVCSMGDLFHEDVPTWVIWEAMDVILQAKQHEFLILTKRPGNMKRFFDWYYNGGGRTTEPLKNLWLGVTAENRPMWVERVNILKQLEAAKRFVSYEPALGSLGEVDLSGLDWVLCGGETGPKARPMHPDWARSLRDQCQAAGVPFFFKQWGEWAPFYDRDKDDPDWRNIPKESPSVCRTNLAGGHGFHGDRIVYFRKVGKKAAGRLLDGREWNEMPEVAR